MALRRIGRHIPEGSASARAIEQIVSHCVRAEAPSGDLVVLHVPTGIYLRLDSSASVIVDLLISTGDADGAAAELSSRYSIPRERADADIASVVESINALKASRGSTPHRPTASGAIATVRSWWRLPSNMRLAVCRATVATVVVELGLRLTDVSRVATWMRVPLAAQTDVTGAGRGVPGGTPREGGPSAAGDESAIGRLTVREQRDYVATTWVLDRWLYDGTCLRRALVSGFFLRRHNSRLHLGLIDAGETSHAWVEAEGMTFNAVPVTGTFTREWGGVGHGS